MLSSIRRSLAFALSAVALAACGGTDAADSSQDVKQKPVEALSPLVEYSFGNQVSRSEVVINSDGSIVHLERAGGGKDFEEIKEKSLKKAQLKKLRAAIAAAAEAESTFRKGPPATAGAKTGYLGVYAEDGEQVVIHGVIRDGDDPYLWAETNDAAEAKVIEELVFAIAENDMPDADGPALPTGDDEDEELAEEE